MKGYVSCLRKVLGGELHFVGASFRLDQGSELFEESALLWGSLHFVGASPRLRASPRRHGEAHRRRGHDGEHHSAPQADVRGLAGRHPPGGVRRHCRACGLLD